MIVIDWCFWRVETTKHLRFAQQFSTVSLRSIRIYSAAMQIFVSWQKYLPGGTLVWFKIIELQIWLSDTNVAKPKPAVPLFLGMGHSSRIPYPSLASPAWRVPSWTSTTTYQLRQDGPFANLINLCQFDSLKMFEGYQQVWIWSTGQRPCRQLSNSIIAMCVQRT